LTTKRPYIKKLKLDSFGELRIDFSKNMQFPEKWKDKIKERSLQEGEELEEDEMLSFYIT
jgi:hypothetical protein